MNLKELKKELRKLGIKVYRKRGYTAQAFVRKSELVRILATVDEAVAKEFVAQYPKPTQENFEKFVTRRGYDAEEISELLYDLRSHHKIMDLEKPPSSDSLDDITEGGFYEFISSDGGFRLPESEVGNLGLSKNITIDLVDDEGEYLEDQIHIIEKIESYAPEAKDISIQSVTKKDGFISRFGNEWVADETREGLVELLEQLESGEYPHVLT